MSENEKFLKQEEIEALLKVEEEEPEELNQVIPEGLEEPEGFKGPAQVSENQAVQTQGSPVGPGTGTAGAEEDPATGEPAWLAAGHVSTEPAASPVSFREEEKDALGEAGNICMGSAATTLSILLNQKVSITSPRVDVTTIEELYKDFSVPHMTIFVRFLEGLSGHNLLVMKLQDASILADLMMGGDGLNPSEDMDEIGVSAASEAMNQMIGSASTAMATMFSTTVNISPPETKIVQAADEQMELPDMVEAGPVVVVWFKMAIGDILDTYLMQIMGVETAREQAGLILGQLQPPDERLPVVPEEPSQFIAGNDDMAAQDIAADPAGFAQEDNLDDLLAGLKSDAPGEPAGPAAGSLSPESPVLEQDRLHTVAAAAPVFKRFDTAPPANPDQGRMELIMDIPLKVTVVLGRTKWPIKNILGLTPGAVVEMQSLVEEPVEVLVNGTLVAFGEVVVVNENFGVRINNIISPEDRLKNLRKQKDVLI